MAGCCCSASESDFWKTYLRLVSASGSQRGRKDDEGRVRNTWGEHNLPSNKLFWPPGAEMRRDSRKPWGIANRAKTHWVYIALECSRPVYHNLISPLLRYPWLSPVCTHTPKTRPETEWIEGRNFQGSSSKCSARSWLKLMQKKRPCNFNTRCTWQPREGSGMNQIYGLMQKKSVNITDITMSSRYPHLLQALGHFQLCLIHTREAI